MFTFDVFNTAHSSTSKCSCCRIDLKKLEPNERNAMISQDTNSLELPGLDVSGTLAYCFSLFSFGAYAKASVFLGRFWSTVHSDLQPHAELLAASTPGHGS
jgi:hypothetical protein